MQKFDEELQVSRTLTMTCTQAQIRLGVEIVQKFDEQLQVNKYLVITFK